MPESVFIHLHTHSAYSLAEGAIKVKELVKLCLENNMPAAAVTDTNNLFGAMEFAVEAQKAGIQPIIGAQVNVGADGHQLVLLAQTEEGYRNLCRLLSDAYLQGDPQKAVHIEKNRLAEHAKGLICLTGGSKGAAAQYLFHQQDGQAEEEILFLKKIFGDRLYIELQRHGWAEEEQTEARLVDLAYKYDIPLVATNDNYYPEPENYEAHDALLCIAEGRYITEEDRRKVTPEHYFKSAEEMAELFKDLPEAVQNTVVIAQRCSFLLQPVQTILPAFKTEGGRSELEELKAQAHEGLEWRLKGFEGEKKQGYFDRLAFELGVIEQMGFPGYFLIVSDFIRWAKDHSIPVGPGRGSGAGSVVAWALRITDLDPLEHHLLFERFLNPERISMPDFDIDFCQERRDEVIKYVQDKYGYDRVAQIITFGKLQARAVVRDVGRVLQMPYGVVDRIAKLIPNNPAAPVTLKEALEADPELQSLRDKDDTNRKLIDVALQLEGLYRHASTHAAGVVIGDRALHELVPMYRDPRSTMPVTQFNMKWVEQAGLIKFDFLGLKTMTVIQKTLDMIGKDIDLLQIPLDDQKSYQLMASGNTVGVFQLESSGMRDVLKKVKPNRFDDIVALVSLYRPGPMDNIPRYVAVKEGKEEADYLHPKLKPLLEDTYGIMIYQEQVMQAAQVLAGYTLGGADLLRRAMGKKIKKEMDEQRATFVMGAKEFSGVSRNQAEEIFNQIDKFAGYGFNKSHAAAYALIAYWTAWLKANYPLEFMAASMTLDMGNTDKLAVFKQDLDRMEVKILLPDINKSMPVFKVEDNAIRYALAALKGVGAQAMEGVVKEREAGGGFKSLDDFMARIDPGLLNKRQIEHLAAAGGFESLNPNRAQVYTAAEIVLRHAQSLKAERESGQVNLFGGEETKEKLVLPPVKDWDPLERLAKEFAAVGFYLSAHPLDSRQMQFANLNIVSISKIESLLADKQAVRVQMAGVLLRKQEKISAKGNKFAFLQLSDPTGIFEVTLFSEMLAQSREFLEAGQSLLLTVDAEQREDQVRFTAQKIEKLDKALEGKIKEIRIYIDSAVAAPKIRKFLDIEGKGQAQVALFVTLEDRRIAKIQLPGRWNLSAQARNQIRAEEGVREILEA
ncbi:MAG: DNA polymerase III subunit alpha [Alphaproteobacteria bacterium]|nr:DNA polymerase III subunit alpha [Alphaproteobacteria bacterium]